MKKTLNFIKQHLFLLLSAFFTIVIIVVISIQFVSFRNTQVTFVVRDGIEVQKLSDYLPKLKGSIGDSNIYVIGEQKADEPSILVFGGVHPNEPAGQMATVLLLEQIKVTTGTVYIITEANRSAYSHTHPQEGSTMYYEIGETLWGGTRTFKYGSRATNPVDQWPVSDVYVHNPSGQRLSGQDTRNLNRSFPGNENGNYTEQVAAAIVNLINQKNITLVLDFHEASPEYKTNNAFISHDKVKPTGISGTMDLTKFGALVAEDSRFAPIKVEFSPTNLHGLTHLEIGDHTDALAFLAESSNVTQGRIRGPVTSENIVSGVDKFYEKSSALDILFVDHAEPVSLHERAARHVQTFIFLIEAYNDFALDFYYTAEFYTEEERKVLEKYVRYSTGEMISYFDIDFNGLSFGSILDNGIGYYLRDPENPDYNYWD